MRPVLLRAGARRARGSLLLVGLVFAVLPAGSALADTTIGQVGFGGGGNPGCGPGVVGDPNYVVSSGRRERITSFSFQSASDNAGQQLDFLVLRSAGGSDYTVIGKSGLVTLKGTGLETFQVSPPIRVGERHTTELPTVNIRDSIVFRQPLVHKRVVRRQ